MADEMADEGRDRLRAAGDEGRRAEYMRRQTRQKVGMLLNMTAIEGRRWTAEEAAYLRQIIDALKAGEQSLP